MARKCWRPGCCWSSATGVTAVLAPPELALGLGWGTTELRGEEQESGTGHHHMHVLLTAFI